VRHGLAIPFNDYSNSEYELPGSGEHHIKYDFTARWIELCAQDNFHIGEEQEPEEPEPSVEQEEEEEEENNDGEGEPTPPTSPQTPGPNVDESA